MIIYFINIIKKTIYIIFIIIFLSFILSKHSFASDNIFTVEELEVSGQIDLEFSRNNMIEDAFESAFDNLLSQILNSSDYRKINNTDLKEIEISTKGRHDPCVGIRAVPVGEAMLNCVLLDHYLLNKAQCGN